jgi:hypothetical protein
VQIFKLDSTSFPFYFSYFPPLRYKYSSRFPDLYVLTEGKQKGTLSQSHSHFATDGRSVSMSWCRALSATHDQMFVNCLTVTVLPCSGDLSDERSGLFKTLRFLPLSFFLLSPNFMCVANWSSLTKLGQWKPILSATKLCVCNNTCIFNSYQYFKTRL